MFAASYYQADRRFSAATNADRIATARRGAAGLDLAAGAGRDPWLTDAAAGLVEELIQPGRADAAGRLRQRLRWDRAGLIARATGRRPLTAAKRQAVQDAGLRWLALG